MKYSFSDCLLYTDLLNIFQCKTHSVSPDLRTLDKHELSIALMQTDNIHLCHTTAKFIDQTTSLRNDCLLVMTKTKLLYCNIPISIGRLLAT